jgi:DNA repair protein SbcD/Mre11
LFEGATRMNAISFIHTADLHLDSPFSGLSALPEPLKKRIQESTFSSLSRIIDTAIEEKVDFIVISGDVYDSENRSLRAQIRFRKELERLDSYNIDAFIIFGNHDHASGSWEALTWPKNTHFFSENEVEVKTYLKNGEALANIYGFSYPRRAVTKNMTAAYQKREGAKFHIGLLHGSCEGETEHSRYAPFSLSDLLNKEFDYWALGHIHKRQILHQHPPIIYPGNIQGRNRKELGDKGCFLVELSEDGTSVHFRETADIIWESLQLSIENFTSLDSFLTYTIQKIEELRRNKEGVFLHLEIVGTGDLHDYFQDYEKLNDFLQTLTDGEEEKENFIWIISTKVKTRKQIDRERLKQQSHFFSDLLALSEDLSQFDEATIALMSHPYARKILSTWTEEEKRELMKEAESYLLTELLRD